MRLDDWETRLLEYLAGHSKRFVWGQSDCGLFASGAVEAMTGVHPFPRFVGAYDTREGAALALRMMGEGTLVRTFDSRFPRCAPGMARRGDLVMASNAMGVCLGGHGVFLGEAEGFVNIPRAAFALAWRV